MLHRVAKLNGKLLAASRTRKCFPTSISSAYCSHLKQKGAGFEEAASIHRKSRYDIFSFCQSRIIRCSSSDASAIKDLISSTKPPENISLGTQLQKSRPWGRSEGHESDSEHLVCPGCGVYMQNEKPKAPGFFTKPSEKVKKKRVWVDVKGENLGDEIWLNPDDEGEISNQIKVQESESESNISQEGENNVNLKKAETPVVCARCHSLRNYGKVKDESVENLLPDFDFEVTVGARLMKTTGSRSTVVMVVDTVDFDGSFPRRVAVLVSKAMEEGAHVWKEGKSGNVPRLVLVATKLDLLPTQVTPQRLENWVRRRSRFGGAEKLHGVHLVSSHKGWGIKNLAEHIKQLAGPRGNVWVIGAQNVGKSTLINAIGKHVGGKVTQLTEAPVPGTTLGILRIEGILPDKAKLYDTPGLLHPYQIPTRLNREEQKMVQIKKELKPRSYRLTVGQCVHVGGLMRVDIEEASVQSLYVTVWVSPLIPLHMGKVENADVIREHHFGLQLQPPIGVERVSELGEWQRREFKVSGNSWDFNSVDIATAGLGWLSFGLKGDATLAVWTYDGVDVKERSALILDRARFFEDAGFTVSNVVSKADKKKSNDAEVNKKNDRKGKKSKGAIGEI